jgi:hypothetical protein
VATPTTPEEWVSPAPAGTHTITGFNPVWDMTEPPLARFAEGDLKQSPGFAD